MGDQITYEIIKQDLNIEMNFIKLYYENLFRSKDEKIREMTLRMLTDSLRHAVAFSSILRSLQSYFEAEEELTHEDTIAFLQEGLKEETDAVALYSEHLRLIESEGIHHKIRDIFSDEIEHEKLVKAAFDRVLLEKM